MIHHLKILFLFVTIFLFISVNGKAQNSDFDLISVHDLKLNQTITLGDSKEEVTGVLGDPENIKQVHWEINDVMVNVYKYDHSTLSFLDNTLESFYIRDQSFVLTHKGDEFKVGDSIDVLNTMFPVSFTNMFDKSMVIYFGVEVGSEMKPSIGYIYIEFDENNIITGVSTRSR
ncbi:hypothetical protein [Rhodohalobacter sp.]|uniref:hypothetical protein n=1 Tax=Rhodohalobacter sp. TaxID=1974210 RepID=UPI002ACD85A0|nr:hypothetical protein [Rhodohalobacter sp.]MDZ7755117.1 hypothetical protein [Rhodohalobacter sp.]